MGPKLVFFLFLIPHLHAGSTASSKSLPTNATTSSPSSHVIKELEKTTDSVASSNSSNPTFRSFSSNATTSSPSSDVDKELEKTTAGSTSTSRSLPKNSTISDVDQLMEELASACLTEKELEELSGNCFKASAIGGVVMMLMKEGFATIGLQEMRSLLDFGPVRPWKHNNYTTPSEAQLSGAPTLEAYYDLREPSSRQRSLDSFWIYQKNLIPAIVYLDKRFPSARSLFRRKLDKIRRAKTGKSLERATIDKMIKEFTEINYRFSDVTKKILDNYECWEN
ncbi:unnamed protein product [Caenorhabditis auriculariae]|uniref:CUT domain-containing protein n=1 Tax=Caenorhabditis auriculariae TaxID=2777116 RepID=A0A8S1HLJ5_9PELO|nr:unnamed protein product [Caenorhabditis auriculariae]